MKRWLTCAGVLLCACGDPTGPAQPSVTLAVLGSDVIYAPAGAPLPEPLQVIAANATTKSPARDITVEWRVVQGSAALSAASATTDEYGVAATTPTPGTIGTYRIRATTARLVGEAPVFEIRVVPPPVITGIAPATVTAGDTITITGQNFSASADDNAVLFDGVRGRVLSATTAQLRVIVPLCMPARTVSIHVALGFVASAPLTASATPTNGVVLDLQPGQTRTFADPAELACVRLPGGIAAAQFLLVAHNVGEVLTAPLRYELRALAPQEPVTAIVTLPTARTDFATAWEQALRLRERELAARGPALFDAVAAAPLPNVGDRREFNVIDSENRFHKATATVRVITQRAIIYVDVEAAAAFGEADLNRMGMLFDDPIYPANVEVFGAVSDIDGNDRVIILFTPRVNQLTPRGEPSFIAGYFYGCDLLSRARCSGSNGGEVFYSLVPDPQGKWGSPRSVTAIVSAVPPVLAHELQHMIHFARRGFSTDALWLSEALAQTAEEIVGDVFLARGEFGLASQMRSGNYSRAALYLAAPARTSMIAEAPPGTIEQRGAGWLFLKYLRIHYGGNDLLRRLTNTTRSSVGNVSTETGQPWSKLLTDFGVAIWADRAPELRGPTEPIYTFGSFNLRAVTTAVAASYPLQPQRMPWGNFVTSGSVPTASQAHFLMQAPPDSSGAPLNLVFSGPRGAPLGSGARAQLTVLRVR